MRAPIFRSPSTCCCTVRTVETATGLPAPMMTSLLRPLSVFAGFALLSVAACAGPQRVRDFELPQAPVPASAYVAASWMGTAGVLVDDGQTAILIDPFVTRPSMGKVAFARPIAVDDARVQQWMDMPGIERTAAVLVGHSHYDHVMDAPAFALRTHATVVGSSSTAYVATQSGLPAAQVHTVQPGEALTFGAFTVRMVLSRHGPALLGRVPYDGNVTTCFETPARARDYRMGGAYGIVIEHPAGTIVHHGSAAWVDGMYDDVDADVVLLGITGRKDTAEYLASVVDATSARRVVPIHWDNFFRGFDRPLAALGSAHLNEFIDHMLDTRPDLQLQTLPLGHARTLVSR